MSYILQVMKEQIQKIVDQVNIKHQAGDNCRMVSDQELERFAELIVRECAGIYDKIDNGNAHLGTEDYLEALHKHFQS